MNNEKVIEGMFDFRTKHHDKINKSFIASYKKLYYELKAKQDSGELEVHEDYIGGSELASDIFKNPAHCSKAFGPRPLISYNWLRE